MREGFIVTCEDTPMRIHKNEHGLPDGGVLVFGQYATLFRTRGRARKAIDRTKTYARGRDLDWPILTGARLRIVPVREEA